MFLLTSLLNFDPLLSPVEQSPVPELREFILYRLNCRFLISISLRLASRAFSKSATENIFALVSFELNRRNLGLCPSWVVMICSGKCVCELNNVDLDSPMAAPDPEFA